MTLSRKVTASAACAFVDRPGERDAAVTTWGEVCRPRLTTSQTGGRLAILDYRAPAGFGPGRHVHVNDDEIFILQQGSMVVWSPDASRTATAGDLVFLPRGVPHTWRAYGPEPVHLQVIVAPGRFETFFRQIAEQGLTLADESALKQIAADIDVEFLGPPLSDGEVATMLRGERV